MEISLAALEQAYASVTRHVSGTLDFKSPQLQRIVNLFLESTKADNQLCTLSEGAVKSTFKCTGGIHDLEICVKKWSIDANQLLKEVGLSPALKGFSYTPSLTVGYGYNFNSWRDLIWYWQYKDGKEYCDVKTFSPKTYLGGLISWGWKEESTRYISKDEKLPLLAMNCQNIPNQYLDLSAGQGENLAAPPASQLKVSAVKIPSQGETDSVSDNPKLTTGNALQLGVGLTTAALFGYQAFKELYKPHGKRSKLRALAFSVIAAVGTGLAASAIKT